CAVQDHAVDHVDGALATVGGVDGARTTKHHGRCRTWASAGRDDVGPGNLALQLRNRVRAGHRHEAGVNPRNREAHLYRLSSRGHPRNHHFTQPHHVCAKHEVLRAGSCANGDVTLLRHETHRAYAKHYRLAAYARRRYGDRVVAVGVRTHRDIQLGDIHVCPVERLALLGGDAAVDNRVLCLCLQRNCNSSCHGYGQPSELTSKRTHHVLFLTPFTGL